MKAQVVKKDAQRLIRSLKGAFDEVRASHPTKRFNLGLSLVVLRPYVDKTDAEIASLLDVAYRVVSQFDEVTPLEISIALTEYNGVDAQIEMKTKESYEVSKQLEAGTQEHKAAEEAQAIEVAASTKTSRRKA